MKIREGHLNDLSQIKTLAQNTWQQFENVLTEENWRTMSIGLSNDELYRDLLTNAQSFVSENEAGHIIGMSFLVRSGNPTEIFNSNQCYIRFVTVADQYKGLKLGQKLTEKCIDFARVNGEKKIALHTAEMMNKARHIYEKLGFEIIKEIEPRFGKRYWFYEMNL